MGDRDAGDGRRAESQQMPQQERYNLIIYVLHMHNYRSVLIWISWMILWSRNFVLLRQIVQQEMKQEPIQQEQQVITDLNKMVER